MKTEVNAQRAEIRGLSPQTLLAQADVLIVLADLLRPPLRAQVPSPEDAAELARAAFADGDDGSSAILEQLCAAFAQTPQQQWSDDYHRLFEGSLACPINETAYIRRDKGAILADLCGFYRAFGFDHAPGTGEKADHLRCELEFLAMLLVMLAQSIARDEQEAQEVTFDAIRAFAADHLSEWLAMFSERLAQTSGIEAYCLLAAALPAHWQSLTRLLGLPCLQAAQAELDELLQPEPEWPMECGMAPKVSPCDLTVEGKNPEKGV